MKPILVSLIILGTAAAALKRFGPSVADRAHEKCMEMFQRNFAASPPCGPSSESPCACGLAETAQTNLQSELSACGSA